MASSIQIEIARLLLSKRWGALATLNEGAPLASMVAYAPEPEIAGILMFLSGLSAHTRNLLDDPRCSLAVTEADPGKGDPQTLPRVSLQGRVQEISADLAGYAAAWTRYVERFPDAESRRGLGDFRLFRLVVEEARYVGGFARAVTLSGEELREAARALEP